MVLMKKGLSLVKTPVVFCLKWLVCKIYVSVLSKMTLRYFTVFFQTMERLLVENFGGIF